MVLRYLWMCSRWKHWCFYDGHYESNLSSPTTQPSIYKIVIIFFQNAELINELKQITRKSFNFHWFAKNFNFPLNISDWSINGCEKILSLIKCTNDNETVFLSGTFMQKKIDNYKFQCCNCFETNFANFRSLIFFSSVHEKSLPHTGLIKGCGCKKGTAAL